jgi:hypothetical protein
MKKLICILVIILTVPLYAQQWYTEGIKTNPLTDTILAESAQFDFGSTHKISVICATTVGAIIILELRNGANSANVVSQAITLVAMTPFAFSLGTGLQIDDVDGGRMRIRLNSTIVGQAQCSLFIE